MTAYIPLVDLLELTGSLTACQLMATAGGGGTMPIELLAGHDLFEPEEIAKMRAAYDAACEGLRDPEHDWVREIIAARIVAAVAVAKLTRLADNDGASGEARQPLF